jgi:toxin HigB-1
LRFFFANKKLERLYTEEKGAHKYPPTVIDAFFEVMSVIESALDERDLYALKSLHYEKLKGNRSHQRSIRLDRQFRLILERARDEMGKYFWIIQIEDYH